MTNCETCYFDSGTSYCTVCNSTAEYLWFDLSKCVADCNAENAAYYLNYRESYCILKCDDSTGANHNDEYYYYDDINYKCVP